VAASGIAPSGLLRLPLIYQSHQVGELLVAPRAPGESFSVAERRLLDNIARQAGAAVYAAQLTDHLQHSREQLVLAREEERRRLQRDLHDGLGPQLATLSMQLDVARRLAAEGSPGAADLLGQLSTDTQTAIADIRRLVYNLRPPALDQLGLVGALREYVDGQKNGNAGPRLTVEALDTLPPLPAAVEVAAYRIVQEAVANCLRHANATECVIHLTVDDGLTLEIYDNGRGLPSAVVSGVGLTSMRERAAELGGHCRVESAPGGGTRVIATFPLPEEPRS
jgi:signal transduction histidine kinase